MDTTPDLINGVIDLLKQPRRIPAGFDSAVELAGKMRDLRRRREKRVLRHLSHRRVTHHPTKKTRRTKVFPAEMAWWLRRHSSRRTDRRCSLSGVAAKDTRVLRRLHVATFLGRRTNAHRRRLVHRSKARAGANDGSSNTNKLHRGTNVRTSLCPTQRPLDAFKQLRGSSACRSPSKRQSLPRRGNALRMRKFLLPSACGWT